MADEKPAEKPKTEEKPKEEKPKPGEAGGDAAAAATSKGSSPVLAWGIIGGICIAMLGLGFALAYFVLPGRIADVVQKSNGVAAEEKTSAENGEKKEASSEKKENKESEKKEAAKGEAKESGEGGHGGGGEGAKTESPVKDFILQDVLVNISGTRGARYIKASLFFEAPPHVRKVLEEQRPKVIDLVSQVLSSKSIDQLTADDSRGTLRREILKVINSLLIDDKVTNIYFLDFIIQ